MQELFKPKVVLGLTVNKGKLLLIKRKLPALKVNWAFPGGVTHENETEEEAVVREVKEETGIDVEVKEKLLERKHPDTLVQIVYFSCKPLGNLNPKIGDSKDIEEVEWVPAKEVLDRFTSDVDPKIQKFIQNSS